MFTLQSRLILLYRKIMSFSCSYSREEDILKWTTLEYVITLIILSSVQSLSLIRLFAIPWTAAGQSSLSIKNFRSLPKLMFTELVMTFNHLILCCPFLLSSIFPSIRVFSNESVLHFSCQSIEA